ncbi:hypothetical protein [Clostridium ljungdahlii]|nr:hypothetical protein [Clostridium ljungdahlii]
MSINKIINTRLKSNDDVQEYKLATGFNIEPPLLDNYLNVLYTV